MPERLQTDALLGRVLMVAPPDGWLDGRTDWLDDLQPAGVILFRRNLPPDAGTARRAITGLHAWAAARGQQLLVAMDEEGGFVTQTSAYMPTPPSARALAWAAPADEVRQVYADYARRLRSFGVNVDFAPVCDVNDNPLNPVIGVRSFGTDPEVVTTYARAAHAGLRAGGLLTCAKHFPGHGDTDVDSHLALPVVTHARERLERVELVPFRAVLGEVPMVMVAHLACPALGDEMLPATLAPRVATGLLRQELRFTGLAITDSMDMQGVVAAYGFEDAAVRALLAGCDLLLYCFEIDKPQRARDGLREAVASGRLPRARLEEAAARVARLQGQAADLAGSSGPVAADSDPQDASVAARYRELCRRALQVHDPAGWRRVAHAARQHGKLFLAGWQEDLVARLTARVGARGIAVQPIAPEALTPEPGVPVIVVLGERRPLAAERVGSLRRLALAHEPLGLANLLTPEVDAPLVELFTTILRSADSTDAMLDVVAERVLGEETLSR